jgi:hypothetical protein
MRGNLPSRGCRAKVSATTMALKKRQTNECDLHWRMSSDFLFLGFDLCSSDLGVFFSTVVVRRLVPVTLLPAAGRFSDGELISIQRIAGTSART